MAERVSIGWCLSLATLAWVLAAGLLLLGWNTYFN
ncbi:hypothetical protein [Escherichia coli]